MSLKSMTGFGRAESINKQSRISVELKSVNSRFLDLSIKMPKTFNAVESKLRQRLKEHIARGKVDVYISYEDLSKGSRVLRLNVELAEEYLASAERLREALGLEGTLGLSQLLSQPEVLELCEESREPEELWEELEPVLERALESFVEARALEGESLGRDLLEKLDSMEGIVSRIEDRAPEIVDAYEKRLRERVTELLGAAAVEESRIVQEVTIYADKVSTDEELVRLHSHINGMRKKLLSGGELGRELDFLTQEMNREANTILSKANDLISSDEAIGLKTLIEKLREQIQNLE